MEFCSHDDGELRAFVELRKTDDPENPWIAVGYVCGKFSPEVIIETDNADEAIMECGYILGDVAAENDEILAEGPYDQDRE